MSDGDHLSPSGWFVAGASVIAIIAGAWRGFCTAKGIAIKGDFAQSATSYGPPLLLGGAMSLKSLSTDQKLVFSAFVGAVVGVAWMAVGFGVGYAVGTMLA